MNKSANDLSVDDQMRKSGDSNADEQAKNINTPFGSVAGENSRETTQKKVDDELAVPEVKDATTAFLANSADDDANEVIKGGEEVSMKAQLMICLNH
jgi:hypothetical protein